MEEFKILLYRIACYPVKLNKFFNSGTPYCYDSTAYGNLRWYFNTGGKPKAGAKFVGLWRSLVLTYKQAFIYRQFE